MEKRNNELYRVLCIPDLHAPWVREGFLEHCIKIKKKYSCNKIVFLGDILDNNFSNYYEINSDGYSAGEELMEAIKILKPWIKAFPEAIVTIGNHDRLILRKAQTAGLSKHWIRDLNNVINAPKWQFKTEILINNNLYCHGEGCSNLKNAILNKQKSMVIAHYHSLAQIIYNASNTSLLWGMACGAGINDTSYNMDYAKFNLKKSIIACGVVINNIPYLEPQLL